MTKPRKPKNGPGNVLTPRRIFWKVFTKFVFQDLFTVLCCGAPLFLGKYCGHIWALLAGIVDIVGWFYVTQRFVFKLRIEDVIVVIGVPGPLLVYSFWGLSWGLGAVIVVLAAAILVARFYLGSKVIRAGDPTLPTRFTWLMLLVLLVIVTGAGMVARH